MLGWMDDEALHRTLTTGRATYWSRSRQEYWVKGETSGHTQHVKEVAPGLRRRHAAGHASTRSAPPATPATAPASTPTCCWPTRRAPREPRRDAVTRPRSAAVSPDARTFRPLARDRRVIPVTRRLLADDETPVGLYRKLAGDRPDTFLLESAENGRRGRATPSSACARGHPDRARRAGALARHAADRACPTDGDPLDALRDTVATLHTPRAARPAAAHRRAWSATSATTSCAGGWRRLPDANPDDLGSPSWRCCSSATWPCSTTTTARSG